MRVLANPVLIRMALLFIFAASLLILGVWLMRRLRSELVPELSARAPRAENAPAFAVAAFQSVIQQLKDKEQELQKLRQAAHERAAAAENIGAAVLTNLETGVVVFNRAGLVQQANPAAREILGFATVSGMHARDLFRGLAALDGGERQAPATMGDALERTLCDAAVFRRLQGEYATPAGEQRTVSITLAPALGDAGECYGAVCLVSVKS